MAAGVGAENFFGSINSDALSERSPLVQPKAATSSNRNMDPFASLLPQSDDEAARGLTELEARERLERVGPNSLSEKEETWLQRLIPFYWGPMPCLIEVAVIVTLALQDWADFGVLFGLLNANAALGFYEAQKAGNAIAALKQSLQPTATAFRDGEWKEVDKTTLVPGDKIKVKMGDVVSADCILLPLHRADATMEIDQAALTGESIPAKKRAGDLCYAGSVVKKGEGEAWVKATGKNSFFGKAATLIESVDAPGHFQIVLVRIAKVLIFVAVLLVGAMLIAQIVKGSKRKGGLDNTYIKTLVKQCLVLLVASIPIALPAVATGTMAVGASQLSKENVIVSRLSSIEELAGMDMLCSDKTGTLTKNELTLDDPWLNHPVNPQLTRADIVLAAALGCDLDPSNEKDAIDGCILESSREELDAGFFASYTQLEFEPFNPTSKMTFAMVEDSNGRRFRVAKGAPQVLFALGNFSAGDPERVAAAMEALAQRGLRPVGVAWELENGDWEYIGLLSFLDPPRDDTKDTIRQAQELGVRVKMITGDHQLIAAETCRRLGMGDQIQDNSFFLTAHEENPEYVSRTVEHADGFAQVLPEDKYFVVDVLQRNGHITGMTGDGVNDAPALKKADVGIAVLGCTDAARAASDLVLLTAGLSVIILAIHLSRQIFQRMRNYVIYRIGSSLEILGFVFLCIVVYDVSLSPIVLVLLTLLNDGVIMSIAYDNVKVNEAPESWRLFRVIVIAAVIAALGILGSTAAVYLAKYEMFLFTIKRHIVVDGVKIKNPDMETSLATVAYLALSLGGQLSVFIARTKGFVFSRAPSMGLAMAVAFAGIVASLLSRFWPSALTDSQHHLSWKDVAAVWIIVLVMAIIKDLCKVAVYAVMDSLEAKYGPNSTEALIENKMMAYVTVDRNEPALAPDLRFFALPARDRVIPEGAALFSTI